MKIDFKLVKPFLEKHGPTILTGLASLGVVLTGYLTHKAAMDTLSEVTEAVLFEDDSDIPVKETTRRVVKKNWKRYIPAGLTGLCTIAFIIGADRWHISKEGAFAAAALMYKTSSEELEKSLKDQFGDEAVQEAKAKLAEKKADENRPPWIDKNPEKLMIWEPYSEQWLHVTQKDILWIELMANKKLASQFSCYLNDILRMFGAKSTSRTSKLGWSYDDEVFCESASYYGAGAWIDLLIEPITRSDGSTFLQLNYGIQPNDILPTV